MTVAEVEPTTEPTAEPTEPVDYAGRYAGFVSRAAAGAIDVVVCAICSTGMIFFIQAFGAVLNSQPIGDVAIHPDLVSAMITGLVIIYFTGSWAVTGRTAGEGLMGLRVVRPNGRHVHLIRSFVRFLVGLFSLLLFGIGFFWMLFDRRRRAWQDLVARTVVIYDWTERP